MSDKHEEQTAQSSGDTEQYNLGSTVPIAGMFDKNAEPIIELGVIQTVPEEQIILDDEPTASEEYQRKARTALSPDEAREVASALNEMADRMEEHADE